jgi:DNA polymerase I
VASMRQLELNKMEQMWLLDGTNIFYQYYHSPFRELSAACNACCGIGYVFHSLYKESKSDLRMTCDRCYGSGREPTKATWLFTRNMLAIIRKNAPKYLCVVFDGNRADLHRRKLHPEYKANRGLDCERPKDIEPQLKRIKQILELLQIPTIECTGYEADDAIATLANKHASGNREVVVVSRDKDLKLLLTNPNIFCFNPITKQYSSLATAGKQFGVRTDQLFDYFTLVGDKVDNIPGVSGCGPKTAVKLLKKYNTFKQIKQAAAWGHLGNVGKVLIASAKQCELTRQLLTLDTKVSGLPELKALKCPELDLSGVAPLFKQLEFKVM